VAVWPYIPRPVARDAAPLPAPAQNTAARRISPLDGPVSVPSATIIAYALSAPQPPYPADEPRGISGTVVVQVTISKEGKVIGIRAVSGPDELRPATVQAVQAWRFRPYLIDGAPVDVTTTLGFLFHGE
jgi:TonB family protein